MDFKELLEKYQVLLAENNKLKEEISLIKAQLGTVIPQTVTDKILDCKSESERDNQEPAGEILSSNINSKSDCMEKIKLFMSLFKGRDDVYAKRWENKKKGTSGYSPYCLNEWKIGLCAKPKATCTSCTSKAYAVLNESVIDDHLRGRNNFVAGIYPLCLDETCHFLAIDFDDGDWQKDISVLREVCSEFKIPVAVERSRSGKGAHAWFFFKSPISASMARKFGSALITFSMSKRHEITFKSYDRFFPNQDTMPKGGLGNLIALPLQKAARKDNNSEFIDEYFHSYHDQWEFLGTIDKLSEDDVEIITSKLCPGNELGVLKIDEEEAQKPWETSKIKLLKNDFPQDLEVVKANMLFVPKAGISQKALNHLKRLAAFKNPEFYRTQAMRMPTARIPRIISCSEETAEYICLPRGCESDLKSVFEGMGIYVNYIDKRVCDKKIDVEFNGSLRDEQPLAINKLLEHDIGVLSGTTVSGKQLWQLS